MRPGELEEGPVNGAPDTLPVQRRVDADEVHIGGFGFCLREETDQEGGNLATVVFDQKAGGGEVLEVQPGQQQRTFRRPRLSLEAAPPRVQYGEHTEMVAVGEVPGHQAGGEIIDHPRSLPSCVRRIGGRLPPRRPGVPGLLLHGENPVS